VGRLNYSRLSDTLLAGAMPHSTAHVDVLAAEGVGLVINLCELREYWVGEREAVLTAYRAAGIRELHLPVKDGATVPARVIDAAVHRVDGAVTYVHCRGGRERSATVATAMLASAQGLTIAQALAMAQLGRPVFQPLPWQLEALHAWRDARVTR
jgi:atypical dual specificity phosphatase